MTVTSAGTVRTTRELMEEAERHRSARLPELWGFGDAAVVVTGGAQGIGRATARNSAELGVALTLVDIHPATAQTARELGAESARSVRAVHADVRDSARLGEIAAEAAAGAARLVWVNAAGIYPSHLLGDLGDEQWDEVVGLDLTGSFHGCRAAALAVRRHGITGVIVNISSVAGFKVGRPPGIVHYASAKHGIHGLTKALAAELGPEGIRVVCLAPGAVVTEGLVERFGEMDLDGGTDYFSQRAQEMPIRRPSLPDDIARAACFLASHAASNVTGVVLPVDAGQLVL